MRKSLIVPSGKPSQLCEGFFGLRACACTRFLLVRRNAK